MVVKRITRKRLVKKTRKTQKGGSSSYFGHVLSGRERILGGKKYKNTRAESLQSLREQYTDRTQGTGQLVSKIMQQMTTTKNREATINPQVTNSHIKSFKSLANAHSKLSTNAGVFNRFMAKRKFTKAQSALKEFGATDHAIPKEPKKVKGSKTKASHV